MAIAFQSQNTIAFQNFDGAARSLTITKPSGLAAGDLLVAVLAGGGGDIDTANFNTPSGWTIVVASDEGGNAFCNICLAKIANSSDAAATNFTFTWVNGTNGIAGDTAAGILMRFTDGYVPTIFDADEDTSGGTTNNYSGGVTPTLADNILLMAVIGRGDNSTVSGYAVTTDNPTWTERLDTNTTIGAQFTFAVATGPRAAITATGNYEATFADSQTDSLGMLVALQEQIDVTVNPSVIATTISVQAPTVSGSANVSPAVVTATFSVPSATVSTPTSTWVNDDKSNTASFTNDTK